MAKDTKYRLADCAVIEPLVNQWSAWAHVISPVAASLHLQNYQMQTMRSYLADPQHHVNANKDAELIGGPFMNIPADRVGEIVQLLDETEKRQARNLELARTVVDYHNWIADEATGQSLEPFYETIPDALRGYVELVYDYYHRPTVRFLESFFYESEYYDKSLQSLRLFGLKRDDERAFFMSTPRLLNEGQIDWRIPFDDPRCDELFKLDSQPCTLDYIRELLGLSPSDDARLLPLLSDEPVATPSRPDSDRVRIKYFGHACALIEWNGVSILTDPFVGAAPVSGGLDRFTYSDLPERIDFALVTHNHQDHYALEALLRLRHRIGTLVVPRSNGMIWGDVSLKLMSRKLGFKNVVELDSLGSIDLPGGSIIAVPFFGEHGDLSHSKSGYVIRAGAEQMLFAADSDCLDRGVYENIRKALGPIQTVFLGMECVGAPLTWSCGPLFPRKPSRAQDQTRRHHGSNANAGMQIMEAVGATRFYNYAMGMEPWLEHLLGLNLTMDSTQIRESNELLSRARSRGFFAAERLYGKREFYLDEPSIASDETIAAQSIADDESYGNAVLDYERAGDAEDQFAF